MRNRFHSVSSFVSFSYLIREHHSYENPCDWRRWFYQLGRGSSYHPYPRRRYQSRQAHHAGNLESLAEVSSSERYAFEQVDICDRAELDRVFAAHQPDAVMHLAAESHVDRSITGPAAFIETNIVGTYTLLEAARAYWNGLDDTRKAAFRFHHISTDEVYGDLPHPDEVAAGEPLPLFTETTPCPQQPYSASKVSSDHLVRAWRRTYGLPTVVTNCSNNYGPYHFPRS